MARSRKSMATHQMIAAAALRVAQEKGAAAVTARDIADASRVSLRTVYNHFPTVSHAILGIDPDQPDRIAERLLVRPKAESAMEALAAAAIGRGVGPSEWRARAELASSDPGLYSAYMSSFAEIDERLTVAMAERLGLDPVRDLLPRLIVVVGLSAFRAVTDFAIAAAQPDASEDVILDSIVENIRLATADLNVGLQVARSTSQT